MTVTYTDLQKVDVESRLEIEKAIDAAILSRGGGYWRISGRTTPKRRDLVIVIENEDTSFKWKHVFRRGQQDRETIERIISEALDATQG